METDIFSFCVPYGKPDAQTVFLQPVDRRELMHMEEELKELSALTDRPFLLLCYPVGDWNRDLSPWQAPPVYGNAPFGGEAEKTLRDLTEHVLPGLNGRAVFLGGYSLAGLFALWASYQTDRFSGVCAASPSVWYPGWTEYAASRTPKTERIYLSLGDREERAKNHALATVGDCIREQYAYLKRDGIRATLYWNSGNHFQDAGKRIARGFAWLLEQM